jgi:hypothetical protein
MPVINSRMAMVTQARQEGTTGLKLAVIPQITFIVFVFYKLIHSLYHNVPKHLNNLTAFDEVFYFDISSCIEIMQVCVSIHLVKYKLHVIE